MRGYTRTVRVMLLALLLSAGVASPASGDGGECGKRFSYPAVTRFHSDGERFEMEIWHDGNWGCGGDRLVFVKDSDGRVLETFFPKDDEERTYRVESGLDGVGDFVYAEFMRDGVVRRTRMFPVRHVDIPSLEGDVYENGELVCRSCPFWENMGDGRIGIAEIAGIRVPLRLGSSGGGERGFLLHVASSANLECERPVVFDISGKEMYVSRRLGRGDYIIYTGDEDCSIGSEGDEVVVEGKGIVNTSSLSAPSQCLSVCAFSFSFPSPKPAGLLSSVSGVFMVDTAYLGSCRERQEEISCRYGFGRR